MSCNTDHYKYALDCMIGWFNDGTSKLTELFGSKVIAIAFIGLAMIPVLLLFGYGTKVAVPKFVKWYYDTTIIERAIEYYHKNCIGLGFKHSTAIISVATGVIFYTLIRVAAAFPTYYEFSIPGLICAFIGVAFLGYAVSGNVPGNAAARNRYFKRFHAPTLTGLGLGIATVLLDFIIHAASLAVAYLQTA
jgi:hypothetical protein